MKLSIIIPIYNEENTLETIIQKVIVTKLNNIVEKEIILINDGSNDTTSEILKKYSNQSNIIIINEKENCGKGASIQKGIIKASGNIIIIQDADLEYNPDQYSKLLEPILSGEADVVYGSRFMSGSAHRVLFYWHSWGNKILTMLSNMFTDLNLTDMECGYKVFKKEIIKQIILKEKRFGFEPEITAKIGKLAKKGKCKIYEVGISYYGRTYEEGKKINWKDGLSAFRCIIKYNLFTL